MNQGKQGAFQCQVTEVETPRMLKGGSRASHTGAHKDGEDRKLGGRYQITKDLATQETQTLLSSQWKKRNVLKRNMK